MANKEASPEKPVASSARRPSLLVVAGGIVVFVVVVLALGLGLGLGLKNGNGGGSSSSSSPSTTGSGAAASSSALPGSGANATSLESWRLDTSQYLLSKDWDLNAAPTTRYYNLTISEGQGWPDGVVRDMLLINGKFPGPVIEVNRGDRVVVNVTNQMSNATTMHWHGLLQNGTNWYDGTTGITQCGIPPGKSFLYNFTIENQFGTFWYHSHFGTQYLDGIIGPLIIHAPEEAQTRQLYDQDQIVIVQDWYHDFSTVNLQRYESPDNENTEPTPDNGLVNGRGYFNCSSYGDAFSYTCYQNSSYTVFNMNPNVRTRFRLINAGAFAEFDFSVDNHTLSVIEADSTLVKPHTVHRAPFHVAQRYSVVVAANQSATTNYWIRAIMNTFCFSAANSVLEPTTLAVLAYSGNTTAAPADGASVDWSDALPVICQDLDDSDLVPATQIIPPPATKVYRVDFSFAEGDYQLEYAKVNGTSWSPLGNTTTLLEATDGLSSNASAWSTEGQVGPFTSDQFVVGLSPSGVEVVDVLVNSLDEGGHPFHLHGHVFWILQTGAGPFNWTYYYDTIMPSNVEAVGNVIRRDTMTIPSYSWALIRIVADNPGIWAFHCHIAWHLQIGLLMQFMSRADVLAHTVVPDDVKALCSSSGTAS